MSNLDPKPNERKYPFRVRCSQRTLLSENYTLPKGYKLMNQPATLSVENTHAGYTKETLVKDGVCSIKETTRLAQRVFEPAHWGDVKQAVTDLKTGRNQMIILNKD